MSDEKNITRQCAIFCEGADYDIEIERLNREASYHQQEIESLITRLRGVESERDYFKRDVQTLKNDIKGEYDKRVVLEIENSNLRKVVKIAVPYLEGIAEDGAEEESRWAEQELRTIETLLDDTGDKSMSNDIGDSHANSDNAETLSRILRNTNNE